MARLSKPPSGLPLGSSTVNTTAAVPVATLMVKICEALPGAALTGLMPQSVPPASKSMPPSESETPRSGPTAVAAPLALSRVTRLFLKSPPRP
jgi:hypothetical protein